MEKLKKWFRKHQRECAGFGVFLVMFVTLTGGVLYYSFVKPPKETKAATEQVVAVTGVKEEAENEETGIGKKSTGTTKDNETETAENDTPNKEQGEKKSEEAEKKDEQEKKQETDQKAGTSNTTEKAATAAASTGNTVETEQPATTDTGDSAPAASQSESSNAQTSQSDQSPVQETPAQDTPAQETPTQPEPEPEPVWHEPVYEQQWVVDQKHGTKRLVIQYTKPWKNVSVMAADWILQEMLILIWKARCWPETWHVADITANGGRYKPEPIHTPFIMMRSAIVRMS